MGSEYLEDLDGHERSNFFVRRKPEEPTPKKNRETKEHYSITIKVQNQTMTTHKVPVSNIHRQLGKEKKKDLGICVMFSI